MMNFHRALPFVGAIAMAGLLSGCGGSSNNVPTEPPVTPPVTPDPPTYEDLELSQAVAAGLTLAVGQTEDLPAIPSGGSRTWGSARFNCLSDTPCMVRLTGTSAGVQAEAIGDVRVVPLENPVAVGGPAVDPEGGATPLAPISVGVVRSATGMTEEALREYIRQDAVRLQLESEEERDRRETEIRTQERQGEPLHQVITMDDDRNVLVNGDGSVTQSSTTHAQDLEVSVAAWMDPSPSLANPGAAVHEAGFSGAANPPAGVDGDDGPRYFSDSRPPNEADDVTKWQRDPEWTQNQQTSPEEDGWSTRIDHDAKFQVDAGWTTPENEDAEWRDGDSVIGVGVPVTHADTFPAFREGFTPEQVVQSLWVERLRQLRSPAAANIPGGRMVNVDLYTDIGRSALAIADAALEVRLKGFTSDDDDGVKGTMHTDWRRGEDVINFDDDEAKSPGELQSGEREVFNAQRPFVRGTYRGIPGTFTCINAATDACHIRHQTGRVNVKGDFRFTPNEILYNPPVDNTRIGERVWNSDWLAIGVWSAVPDSLVHGDYEAGAFADGSDPFDTNRLMAAEGDATYTGLAHGLYTETRTTAAPVVRGRFTADATLTARFGTDSEWGTISGRLRNFTATGGANAGASGGGDWAVNLEEVGIGAEGSVVGSTTSESPEYIDRDPGENHFTADTSGHSYGNAIEGRWGGRFYGNNRVGDQYDHQGQPGYVAGTFGAASKDGPAADGYDLNLIGAFAARRPRAGGDGPGLELDDPTIE